MTGIRCGLVVLLAVLFAAGAQKVVLADEYSVEVIKEKAPSDGVAKEIQDQLADTGLRVKRGSEAFVEIWPRKEWPIKADFQPTAEIKFPLQPGELIGLVRYNKKATDFRAQDIKPGVYTLRFALQPVDGNHVGTSDTRDFFLLVKASDDTSAAPLEEKNMFKLSAKAAGSTHPCMLFIRKPGDATELPSVKHDEEADRWSVMFGGTPKGGAAGSFPVEVNLVGVAKE
jgi:hypothetical protein